MRKPHTLGHRSLDHSGSCHGSHGFGVDNCLHGSLLHQLELAMVVVLALEHVLVVLVVALVEGVGRSACAEGSETCLEEANRALVDARHLAPQLLVSQLVLLLLLLVLLLHLVLQRLATMLVDHGCSSALLEVQLQEVVLQFWWEQVLLVLVLLLLVLLLLDG